MSRGQKPLPFVGLYPFVTFLFIGFAAADLFWLSQRPKFLPLEVPGPLIQTNNRPDFVSRGTYSPITNRNMFSPTIPDSLAQIEQKKKAGETGEPAKDAPPVPSSLPLTLMGTIVHSNPDKSIANIEVKPKSTVIAVRPGKEIDNLATLVSVERGKVIIRNTNSGRLEFLEMKDKLKLSFNATKAPSAAPEVRAATSNSFEVSRADVMKNLSNLSNVLQQASMQPRRKANGEIDCFQFVSIQPKSVFSELGWQRGDCIKSVEGEPIDSPQKALEVFNKLKNADSVNITFERDGRDVENTYRVK